MKLTAQEFLDHPRQAITLLGMSGVGKSYISSMLEGCGWQNYSCDHLIGTRYLKNAKSMEALSAFVGQVGNSERGGFLPLDEFQRRQQLYYEAEMQSLYDACEALDAADSHFVCDSSGSLCEIKDQALMDALGKRSLFIYLKVRESDTAEILKRAADYPKPLYFPPDFLLERLDVYQAEFKLRSVEQIDPVAFLRWVFPFLFRARLSKYEALAAAYGVTIYADQFKDISLEEDVLTIIAQALKDTP